MIAVINDLHLSYGSPFARVGAVPGNCGSLDPASRGVVLLVNSLSAISMVLLGQYEKGWTYPASSLVLHLASVLISRAHLKSPGTALDEAPFEPP